jgi:signal transduction histidine kinase
MRRWSLRFRILFLTLCVEAITVIAFAAVAYHRSRSELLDALDDDLRKECATLARLVEAALEVEPEGTDAMTPLMARIVRLSRHDLYQIMFADGRVIAKSPRLGTDVLNVPPEVRDSLDPGKSRGFDLEWDSDAYRARVMRSGGEDGSPTSDTLGATQPNEATQRDFFVLLAQPSENLDNRLADLLQYVIAIGATALLVSAIALWVVARWGIIPVTRLSSEVETVAPGHLAYRVDADRLPRDLRTLAVSINGFIARLEQAFARERQFVADASHELCTPIALLKSNIQSALLGPPDAVADRRSLEELLGDVERLERLSSSLLALSETEAAGADSSRREEIELRPYLESLVMQFGHSAQQRNVSLEIEGSGNAVVGADRTILDRILSNLIENAIKHNRPGGGARLSVRRNNGGCEIWVADDGPGVPAADVPYLFERFFRVDKSRSRERGGAGLGLAIAKSLCESQGAEIFYRPGPSGGSVFVVRFPQAA